MSAVNPRLAAVVLVVVLVVGGVFGLAFTATITGESALQFVSTIFAAFVGVIVGNQLTGPTTPAPPT